MRGTTRSSYALHVSEQRVQVAVGATWETEIPQNDEDVNSFYDVLVLTPFIREGRSKDTT